MVAKSATKNYMKVKFVEKNLSIFLNTNAKNINKKYAFLY